MRVLESKFAQDAGTAPRAGSRAGPGCGECGAENWPAAAVVGRALSVPNSQPMRLYAGLTHLDWCRYLSLHPELEEVNFWQSKSQFRALEGGEPFLFKRHHPERAICGLG